MVGAGCGALGTLRGVIVEAGTVSSWVAAGVSVLSAGVAVWKAWYWRVTAQWALEPVRLGFSVVGALSARPYGALMGPREQVAVRVVNVGDGTALDVVADSSQGVAVFISTDVDDERGVGVRRRVAQIPPAGEATVVVLPTTRLEGDVAVTEPSRGTPCGEVRVVLSWGVAPARAGRRWERVLVVDGDTLRFEGDAHRVRRPGRR